MPKYTLPKEKKKRDEEQESVGISTDSFHRHVSLPVNKEILEEVSTGDKVTVTLEAEVESTVDREGADYQDRSIGLKLFSVDVYPDEDSKAKKEFSAGYKKAKDNM